MNKENYEGLRKQLDNGSLDIPSQITILEIAYNLEHQLQAYKDKEDKIKEIAKDCLFPNGDYAEVMDVGNKLLRILNEGDK